MERASETDGEAFTNVFGPEKIPKTWAKFLGYFMVRKVMAGQDLLKSAGTVTKKLGTWLEANGYTDAATAAVMVDQGAGVAVDLPAANRLADALYDETGRLPRFDGDSLSDDDWLDDYLRIENVESGHIWFDGLDQPLSVSTATSKLAKTGSMVNVEMVRLDATWRLVDVGQVYP